MARARPGERRRQILEALARELEAGGGARVTTARLAAVVGVSEAALYRHFPSKARMLEALIEFAEESVFALIARILEERRDAAGRCARILAVLLGFAERNPGIARILTGEALVGEAERLRERVARFYERIETQLRQVLREDPAYRDGPRGLRLTEDANLMLAAAEGRIAQFCRSRFRRPPRAGWGHQWAALEAAIFPR